MEILEILWITTIISAASVFIIRKLIESFFSKDLENFKSQLAREVIIHKKTFETLHKERATVIKKLTSV